MHYFHQFDFFHCFKIILTHTKVLIWELFTVLKSLQHTHKGFPSGIFHSLTIRMLGNYSNTSGIIPTHRGFNSGIKNIAIFLIPA